LNDSEQQIEKDMKGSSHGIIPYHTLTVVQLRHLPNTGQKHYCLSQLALFVGPTSILLFARMGVHRKLNELNTNE
jgi:hypothetical protein